MKDYDDLPEWMRCCAAAEVAQRPLDGMLLEVDPAVRGVSSSTCRGCGKRTAGLLWIRARCGAGDEWGRTLAVAVDVEEGSVTGDGHLPAKAARQ